MQSNQKLSRKWQPEIWRGPIQSNNRGLNILNDQIVADSRLENPTSEEKERAINKRWELFFRTFRESIYEENTLILSDNESDDEDIQLVVNPSDAMEDEVKLVPFHLRRRKRKTTTEISEVPHKKEKITQREVIPNLDYVILFSSIFSFHENNDHASVQKRRDFIQKILESRIKMIWPTNNQKIVISAIRNSSSLEINVITKHDSQLVLRMLATEKELQLQTINMFAPWEKSDILDLVNLFNFALRLPINDQSKSAIISSNKQDLDNPEDLFEDLNDFEQITTKYKDCFVIIPEFILSHTRLIKSEHVFWISHPTPDYPQLSLKLCFTTANFSEKNWVFATDEMLRLHGYQEDYKYQFKYIRLNVYLDFDDEKRPNETKPVLDILIDPGRKFEILNYLRAISPLTGTDGMNIHDKIEHFIHDGTSHLHDASQSIEGYDRAQGTVVLRALKPMVEYGQTLYEQYGYDAVQCENVKAGWKEPDGSRPLITQHVEEYRMARALAPKIKLNDLYQYFIKEEEETIKPGEEDDIVYVNHPRSKTLVSLCKKYKLGDPSKQKANDATLGKLVTLVYNKWKTNREAYSKDLISVYNLLILPLKYIDAEFKPLKENKNPEFHHFLKPMVLTTIFARTREQKIAYEQRKAQPQQALDNKENSSTKKRF